MRRALVVVLMIAGCFVAAGGNTHPKRSETTPQRAARRSLQVKFVPQKPTAKEVFSSAYCPHCRVLEKEMTRSGAEVVVKPTQGPLKHDGKEITEVPLVVYDDGATDAGERLRSGNAYLPAKITVRMLVSE